MEVGDHLVTRSDLCFWPGSFHGGVRTSEKRARKGCVAVYVAGVVSETCLGLQWIPRLWHPQVPCLLDSGFVSLDSDAAGLRSFVVHQDPRMVAVPQFLSPEEQGRPASFGLVMPRHCWPRYAQTLLLERHNLNWKHLETRFEHVELKFRHGRGSTRSRSALAQRAQCRMNGSFKIPVPAYGWVDLISIHYVAMFCIAESVFFFSFSLCAPD